MVTILPTRKKSFNISVIVINDDDDDDDDNNNNNNNNSTHHKCADPAFRLCLVKLCSIEKHCTTASLIKVTPLKKSVCLILKVQNSLFTNPT